MIIRIALFVGALASITTAQAQSGIKYPYVESNRIIVSKDANGGVREEALLTSTQLQEIHDAKATLKEEYNKVSKCFQIAQNQTSSSLDVSIDADKIIDYCKNYSESDAPKGSWRLPTLRELQLIWDLSDKLTPKYYTSSIYGSITGGSFNRVLGIRNYNYSYYDILEYSYSNDNKYCYVRCVRDL